MNHLLDSFTLPVCLSRPRRISHLSAWIEHIPFGMNLVAALRPATLVELGTHAGDSYCAFCQAASEAQVAVQCFAVDTWQGDAQAGFYGPEVLAGLRTHHDPLYGGFSRLIQSTFDEALRHFADRSVDLLHIDGLHTYEAVRHDFEAWLPKLSGSGVVLMHDINVREGDFGVARLWAELRQRYPSFEFAHGHGLGVLSMGAAPPAAIEPLLRSTAEDTAVIRAFFFELGCRLSSESGARQEMTRLGEALDAAQRAGATASSEAAESAAAARAAEVRAAALEARAVESETLLVEREQRLAEVEAELASVRREAAATKAALAHQNATLDSITGTTAWRLANRYWHTRDRLLGRGGFPRQAFDGAVALLKGRLGAGRGEATAGSRAVSGDESYQRWLDANVVSASRIEELRATAARFGFRPLISVITPVYDIDEAWLRRCIESVREQVYEHWELCLVDDASPRAHVARVLAEYAAADTRIRTRRLERNSGIVAASRAALEMASGDFVALLDHDDELSPDALYEVARELQGRRDLDVIYSDEDKLDEQGHRVEPFFKPDWSPDLFLSMNYLCHLTVARHSLVQEVGGFREGFDGSQDYDLLLRLTERTAGITRIPKVLYHWRKVPNSAAASRVAKPYALEAGRRAIESALERRGIAGRVTSPHPGTYRVAYDISDPPLVSIIMPTRDRPEMLRTCIESIERKSTYRRYELLVVDNRSREPEALRYLEEVGRRHRVLRYEPDFNWSAINNVAAGQARGSLLLFMNNDMEVINGDWLEALVEHAQRPEVGAVGARLLYPDGRFQHAGVVTGLGGVAGHAFKYFPGDDRAYFHLPQVVRDTSAVTGACMMVRREEFERVGRFDERLRVAFNDVDFCLRLRAAGKLIVYTPYATLCHFESASRGPSHPPEDEALMRRRWAEVLANDPYYNPNLTLAREDYSLRI